MFIECITTVRMLNGSTAFTAGHIYEAYTDDGIIVVSPDDRGEEHEVSDRTGTADSWFQRHFKVTFGKGALLVYEAYDRAMKGI